MSDQLKKLLGRGRNGSAILFCGAGLTADCLNFETNETLGITAHLLKMLNEGLKLNGKAAGYRNVQIASEKYKDEIGEVKLMNLLKERFDLKNVSASIVDIVKYPWHKIYTTNYDNGIELALTSAQKKHSSVNNIQKPNGDYRGVHVVHLHGNAKDWTTIDFNKSCVLDVQSYRRISTIKGWLNQLRFDIERAEIVVFVGFSAGDFHLNEVFFDASGLKEKSFFVNRVSSDPDPDERAMQEHFGTPLYIGREAFSQLIVDVQRSSAPVEPKLSSFQKMEIFKASSSLPSVDEIEGLLVWGIVLPEQISRDFDLSTSDYHIIRSEGGEIAQKIKDGNKIALISGDICNGKSLVKDGALNALSKVFPVFELRHSFTDLLDEVSGLLSFYDRPVFVVENCFDLNEERLLGLAKMISGSSGALILTSRSISGEAELIKMKGLKLIKGFFEIRIGGLGEAEVGRFIKLLDQLAGWRQFKGFSYSEKQRFVLKECGSIIPNVLLRLLNSNYVVQKYQEEYNKISVLDVVEKQMIVSCLLVSNIGENTPVSFVSNIFQRDLPTVLRKFSSGGGLKLVRVEGSFVHCVPSIGAKNILTHIIGSKEIVDVSIFVLEKLADDFRQTDFARHLFTQLMRYSVLSSVVESQDEVNRFFDHISKITYFQDMPLFWLQWHMAMCAQRRWEKADDYLINGFSVADSFERKYRKQYNRKQLYDRKAKFLIARAEDKMRSGGDLLKDFREASDIVLRLLNGTDLTHHPYQTLEGLTDLVSSRAGTFSSPQKSSIFSKLGQLISLAKEKLALVPDGFQREQAARAVENFTAKFSTFGGVITPPPPSSP